MVVELREQLADCVLLGCIVIVIVHAIFVIFTVTAVVAIFKFSVPQTLNLIDLLSAEIAPLF